MSERIAIIGGTGHEGFGFALRWAAAGCQVFIGSRDPAKAEAAARRARDRLTLHAPVAGLPNEEAAGAGEVVVLTIPFTAQGELLPALRERVRGKVVVDTAVPLASFRPPALQRIPEGSAAQRVQALLPEARVVAAFHTVSANLLNALEKPLEQDTLVCGDDEQAKETVGSLARLIGLRPVDAGPLEAAGTVERLAALVIGLNQRYRRSSIGVRFTGL